MDAGAPASRIDAALELSAAMLRLAETADWESVIRLTQDRESMLADLFASPSESPEHLAACIERIQDMDRRLQDYAKAQRRNLGDKLSSLKKGRRVHAAYAQAASD